MFDRESQPLILVVDDAEEIRMVLEKRLSTEGYTVVTVANGEAALAVYQQQQPDVVLLDMHMPKMDGIATCRALKALPNSDDTYILAMSARDEPELVKNAFAAGAADFVTKPFNFPILIHRVNYLVTRRRERAILRQTQSMLNYVLTNAPLLVYAIDTNGVFMVAQGQALGALALSPAVLGRSIFEECKDKSWILESIQNALGGTPSTRLIHHQEAVLQLWHAPLYDADGGIYGVMGVGTNFGEEWKDHALAESQRTIQTLLSNLPGMAYRSHYRPTWQMDFVSEGCYPLTGYHPAQLMSNQTVSFQDLIHPDDLAAIQPTIIAAIRSGEPFQITYRIQTAAGDEKWVWEQGRRVQPRPGEDDALEGFITDITALKEIEAALSTEHNLLRTLIDNLPDFIFAKDLEGRFIISNTANTQYLGMNDPEEIIGKTDFDFYSAERAETFRADDRHVINSRQAMKDHEVPVYYPETQSTRWYAITKAPLFDGWQQVAGIVGLIRDITLQKESEVKLVLANQQLSELNNLKSHFLLTISHELRTPLNSIMGYTDMLLQGLLGELNEKQSDRLQRVQRNSRELFDLIEDMLDISRIQTGQMEINLGAVDFAEVLATCLSHVHTPAQQKGLAIKQDIENSLPPILGDRDAIVKILDNLLSNAVKFTQEGFISIGAQPIPAEAIQNLPVQVVPDIALWVMLSIQDTGIGISAEVQKHLFDVFRQADGSATREHGGTGLGLAISHKLVELMDGAIWLESAPGFGSTFFVLLPAAG